MKKSILGTILVVALAFVAALPVGMLLSIISNQRQYHPGMRLEYGPPLAGTVLFGMLFVVFNVTLFQRLKPGDMKRVATVYLMLMCALVAMAWLWWFALKPWLREVILLG